MPKVGKATLEGVSIMNAGMTVKDLMNARFGVGSRVPNRAVYLGLVATLLLPVLTAGCDIFEPSPSSSEEVVLEPFETTWLSEPGLEFGVTLADTGERVGVDVRVTNRNDVPMWLEWGLCSLKLALYHDAARSNLARVWSTSRTCLDQGIRATVAPGETIHPDEFIGETFPVEVLDLPTGAYFLSVRVDINDHVFEIPAGEVLLR